MRVPFRDYTVYNRKTTEVLAFGTAKECAKQLGIKHRSFYCLVTRAKQRPNGLYEVVVEEGNKEEQKWNV